MGVSVRFLLESRLTFLILIEIRAISSLSLSIVNDLINRILILFFRIFRVRLTSSQNRMFMIFTLFRVRPLSSQNSGVIVDG